VRRILFQRTIRSYILSLHFANAHPSFDAIQNWILLHTQRTWRRKCSNWSVHKSQ